MQPFYLAGIEVIFKQLIMKSLELILPDYTRGYVSLVEKDRLHEAIRKNTKAFRKLLRNIPDDKINYAYAPGKWTIKQMLQHITDAERVFAFRALWFARRDASPMPGFDENNWASHAPVTMRHWDDMVKEYRHVRKSTELMFRSFSLQDLQTQGISNNNPINVAALGYLCAGHVAHHINIIKERYLDK